MHLFRGPACLDVFCHVCVYNAEEAVAQRALVQNEWQHASLGASSEEDSTLRRDMRHHAYGEAKRDHGAKAVKSRAYQKAKRQAQRGGFLPGEEDA